jgi:uncharacterized protein (TIGR03435 family)
MSCFATAAALAAIGLANGWLARAQAPADSTPPRKFEVASIKPSQSGSGPFGIRPAPGGERYVASHVTLKLLITVAYRIKADQVTGGPPWMDSDLYDMNAKAEGPSSIEELHAMLQDLLADRFKLRFHREAKELPIYALTVEKDGPKLKPHEAHSGGDPWIEPKADFDSANGRVKTAWHATFASMDFFAWRLSMLMDRPVVNQTNLTGSYDFDLAFTQELAPRPPDAPAGALFLGGAPADASNSTMVEAIRRQLGLKLERQKGPVEILVIDQAEKPIEN